MHRSQARRTAGLLLAVSAGLAATAAAPAVAAEHSAPQHRVVVADGRSGDVRVYNARNGRRVARLRVAGAATLTTLGDGRHVAATQGAKNRVDAIDAGAWSVSHGDHLDHHAVGPRLLPFRLRVPDPVHVVPHGRQVAIFADGSGEGHVFDLAAMRRKAAGGVRLPTGKAHHGVAVPFGDRFVISEAAAGADDGSLPSALTWRDRSGAALDRTDGCPEMHGEASGATWAAFACENGILVVGAPGEVRRLAYPERTSTEQRSWSIHGDERERRLVGDFGERALVMFDLASGASRVVRVAREIASFTVEPASGAPVVLTTDGRLRRLDPVTGRQTAVTRVVARRFTPSWQRPSPKLAVHGRHVVVSDPARRAVTVVRIRGLERVTRLRVPGRPTSVALAG